MSSAAIMAMIKVKEEELRKLKNLHTDVEKVQTAVSCAASKFAEAGEYIKDAGTLDGRPFDDGKTANTGKDLALISADTEGVVADLKAKMAELEAEIQDLYAQYEAALEWERQEAARRARLKGRIDEKQ